YEDWVRYRAQAVPERPAAAPAAAPAARAVSAQAPRTKPRKLSYKEQRELDALPARIEALEAEQQRLQAAAGDPGFYRQPGADIAATMERLRAVAAELADGYARWDELESQTS